MSKAQTSQENACAEQHPATGSTSEESIVTRKPAPKTRGAKRDSAHNGAPRPAGRSAASKPGAENGGDAPAPNAVPSVAELAATVCRNPERRRKRLKLSESFRECGLDESKLAEYSFAIVQRLSLNTEAGAVGVANTKLLLEVLKDVAHTLEPQKTSGANEATDAPQFVRLMHNVPRPVRTE